MFSPEQQGSKMHKRESVFIPMVWLSDKPVHNLHVFSCHFSLCDIVMDFVYRTGV